MALFDVCSDLHLDFGVNGLTLVPGAPTLLLAGDVLEVDLLRGKQNVAARNALEFLRTINSQYERVIWVFGNHEFYSGSIIHARSNMQDILNRNDLNNIRILESGTVEVEDCIVFGATLWTSFRNGNPLSMMTCETMMSDYNCILVPEKGEMPRKLRTDDTAALHVRTIRRLKDFIALETPLKKVLMTHHAVSMQSIAEHHRTQATTDAYVTDLEDLLAYSDIVLAVHGHTHHRSDYMIDNCRVVVNPRGYPTELVANSFAVKTVTV